MRLLGITDLHGDYSALDRILEDAGPVDLVLLGGDITHFGTPNAAESIVRHVQRAGPRVLAVAGNCDSAAIDQRLADLGVSLFRRGVVQQGVGFYGVSAMPLWHGTTYELTEADIAAALQTGREQVLERPRSWEGQAPAEPWDASGVPGKQLGGSLVLPASGPTSLGVTLGRHPEVVLSHPPPHDTSLDLTRRGAHVGSLAVRKFLEEVQPALVICGHIHEARGVDTLGPTTLVNCGHALRGQYALAVLDAAVHVELRAADAPARRWRT